MPINLIPIWLQERILKRCSPISSSDYNERLGKSTKATQLTNYVLVILMIY